MDRPLRRIGLFLALTILISSIFYALIAFNGHVGGGNGTYELGLMWSPALAALIASHLSGLSLQHLGWSWGAWRWQWIALGIPLAYTAIAYGVIWLTGLGGVPDLTFIVKTRESLGWTGAPDCLVVGGYFLLIASAGMVMSVAFALGEEIGWRGFLAPHMTEVFGFKAGAVLTGIIWAAWHMPLVFLADYNSATQEWFGVSCFAVLMIAMSIIMSWLRLTSGSLWTAALFHASHNQFIQVFFTPITSARRKMTAYAVDEFGFVLPIVVLICAAFFGGSQTR